MSAPNFSINAEKLTDEEFLELSQASSQSQFRFEEDSDSNYDNDSEYLPSSADPSSQEFSQVDI
jgi:hypothetical protein